MRRKQAAIALTLVVAALAVGAPVLLAIQEAQRQGRAIETERVLGYARDVLMRTDATAAQVDRGFKLLAAARNGAPCSEANIDLMRQIDVTSSYIQAIGYVEDGRIACSSPSCSVLDSSAGCSGSPGRPSPRSSKRSGSSSRNSSTG